MDSVKAFFAILLAVALLAFIIIVIMGTLIDTEVSGRDTETGSFANETINLSSGGLYIPSASIGQNISGVSVTLKNVVVRTSSSSPSQIIIQDGNYTLSGALITGTTGANNTNLLVNVSGTVEYSKNESRATPVLTNVSSGVTDFFGSMSSVFTVLAVVVIILTLVVLVRIVGGGSFSGGGGSGAKPRSNL